MNGRPSERLTKIYRRMWRECTGGVLKAPERAPTTPSRGVPCLVTNLSTEAYSPPPPFKSRRRRLAPYPPRLLSSSPSARRDSTIRASSARSSRPTCRPDHRSKQQSLPNSARATRLRAESRVHKYISLKKYDQFFTRSLLETFGS